MAFKLKSSSPIAMHEGKKHKVKYQNNPMVKEGYNTLEKDAAQLASSPYKPLYDKDNKKIKGASNSYATQRANSRMQSYRERGGKDITKSQARVNSFVKSTISSIDKQREKTKFGKKDIKLLGKEVVTPKTKFGKTTKANDVKITSGGNTGSENTNKKTSFKAAYAKRDKKVYGKLSQAEFTAESKRQIASKKAGKGYDAPKKQMSKTVTRDKVKAIEPIKAKGENVVPRKTKLKNKEVKSTKLSKRTERTRAKGEAALASGDKKKALRLRRKVDRQEARGAKKEVRGAKREARKTNKVIKPKKVDQVVKPKKTVEIEKSKEKKKKTSRSGIMI